MALPRLQSLFNSSAVRSPEVEPLAITHCEAAGIIAVAVRTGHIRVYALVDVPNSDHDHDDDSFRKDAASPPSAAGRLLYEFPTTHKEVTDIAFINHGYGMFITLETVQEPVSSDASSSSSSSSSPKGKRPSSSSSKSRNLHHHHHSINKKACILYTVQNGEQGSQSVAADVLRPADSLDAHPHIQSKELVKNSASAFSICSLNSNWISIAHGPASSSSNIVSLYRPTHSRIDYEHVCDLHTPLSISRLSLCGNVLAYTSRGEVRVVHFHETIPQLQRDQNESNPSVSSATSFSGVSFAIDDECLDVVFDGPHLELHLDPANNSLRPPIRQQQQQQTPLSTRPLGDLEIIGPMINSDDLLFVSKQLSAQSFDLQNDLLLCRRFSSQEKIRSILLVPHNSSRSSSNSNHDEQEREENEDQPNGMFCIVCTNRRAYIYAIVVPHSHIISNHASSSGSSSSSSSISSSSSFSSPSVSSSSSAAPMEPSSTAPSSLSCQFVTEIAFGSECVRATADGCFLHVITSLYLEVWTLPSTASSLSMYTSSSSSAPLFPLRLPPSRVSSSQSIPPSSTAIIASPSSAIPRSELFGTSPPSTPSHSIQKAMSPSIKALQLESSPKTPSTSSSYTSSYDDQSSIVVQPWLICQKPFFGLSRLSVNGNSLLLLSRVVEVQEEPRSKVSPPKQRQQQLVSVGSAHQLANQMTAAATRLLVSSSKKVLSLAPSSPLQEQQQREQQQQQQNNSISSGYPADMSSMGAAGKRKTLVADPSPNLPSYMQLQQQQQQSTGMLSSSLAQTVSSALGRRITASERISSQPTYPSASASAASAKPESAADTSIYNLYLIRFAPISEVFDEMLLLGNQYVSSNPETAIRIVFEAQRILLQRQAAARSSSSSDTVLRMTKMLLQTSHSILSQALFKLKDYSAASFHLIHSDQPMERAFELLSSSSSSSSPPAADLIHYLDSVLFSSSSLTSSSSSSASSTAIVPRHLSKPVLEAYKKYAPHRLSAVLLDNFFLSSSASSSSPAASDEYDSKFALSLMEQIVSASPSNSSTPSPSILDPSSSSSSSPSPPLSSSMEAVISTPSSSPPPAISNSNHHHHASAALDSSQSSGEANPIMIWSAARPKDAFCLALLQLQNNQEKRAKHTLCNMMDAHSLSEFVASHPQHLLSWSKEPSPLFSILRSHAPWTLTEALSILCEREPHLSSSSSFYSSAPACGHPLALVSLLNNSESPQPQSQSPHHLVLAQHLLQVALSHSLLSKDLLEQDRGHNHSHSRSDSIPLALIDNLIQQLTVMGSTCTCLSFIKSEYNNNNGSNNGNNSIQGSRSLCVDHDDIDASFRNGLYPTISTASTSSFFSPLFLSSLSSSSSSADPSSSSSAAPSPSSSSSSSSSSLVPALSLDPSFFSSSIPSPILPSSSSSYLLPSVAANLNNNNNNNNSHSSASASTSSIRPTWLRLYETLYEASSSSSSPSVHVASTVTLFCPRRRSLIQRLHYILLSYPFVNVQASLQAALDIITKNSSLNPFIRDSSSLCCWIRSQRYSEAVSSLLSTSAASSSAAKSSAQCTADVIVTVAASCGLSSEQWAQVIQSFQSTVMQMEPTLSEQKKLKFAHIFERLLLLASATLPSASEFLECVLPSAVKLQGMAAESAEIALRTIRSKQLLRSIYSSTRDE